ncbi:hypothetical protein SAMN05428964_104381 [Thalassospira xiamenensis]|uniref:Uncharacterized protein n=1 Tax=Thalassospira xiamenensis TaxID=220697 RepID=A0A285TP73_9PROT|nr:hypothetical protein SAMN05428964_104381 [Thalassospira xiamenensis]
MLESHPASKTIPLLMTGFPVRMEVLPTIFCDLEHALWLGVAQGFQQTVQL